MLTGRSGTGGDLAGWARRLARLGAEGDRLAALEARPYGAAIEQAFEHSVHRTLARPAFEKSGGAPEVVWRERPSTARAP